MPLLSSRFWCCTGSPGCQDLLKHEVLARHPGLKFAFSRPGLVTFKAERELSVDSAIESHLAFSTGLSIGGAKALEDVAPLVRKAWVQQDAALSEAKESKAALRAFAWPTDEDEEPVSATELLRVEEAVRDELGSEGFPQGSNLELGILVPPPARPEYGFWIFARAAGAPAPVEKVTPPPTAPSRAYSKLVEALARFHLTLRSGEAVLELGAAPGGATHALLERGLSVVAVDPAKMDARLAPLALERGAVLRHLEKPAQALVASDVAGLPSPVRWLVSDMNVAPAITVQHVQRARALAKKTLRGAILTLKLNDTAAIDTLPRVLTELERTFGRTPRVAHLPSHRREVVAIIEA